MQIISTNVRSEITAAGTLLRIWQERVFLFASTLLFTLIAGIYVVNSPELYVASIMIGHVSSVENPGTSSSGGGASGALALLGAGGGHNDAKYNLFLTIIKTNAFAHLLEQKYHFVELSKAPNKIDNEKVLANTLNDIVVTQDDQTETALLTLRSGDPQLAKQILSAVVNDGDASVRGMDTQRASRFAGYVEDRFRNENNKAIQEAMASLLVTQERFLMVTKVDLPYAVQLLDGPSASDRPVSPRKLLLLAIGVVAGFVVGILAILVWDAISEERSTRGLITPKPTQFIFNVPKSVMRIFGHKRYGEVRKDS